MNSAQSSEAGTESAPSYPTWCSQQAHPSLAAQRSAAQQTEAGTEVRRGGRGGGALTGKREDAGLGEPAELLEDAAALGDADGEGHVLPARARRRHGRGARAPQLGVVRARLRHDASSPPPRVQAPPGSPPI